MPVTFANVEMAKAWDEEAEGWTKLADRYDAASAALWARFLEARLIEAADRVLDIGCGTGHSTRDAARQAPAGSAVGLDISAKMLDLARQHTAAAGVTNVDFVLGDAQVHPFEPAAFDIAISSFGAMFFADREAAFGNIAGAVRPGGRLAVLTWRSFSENEWLRAMRNVLAAGRELPEPPSGAPGPFGLADADGVRTVLSGAGFEDVRLTPVDEPMWLGADADDAWAFVSHLGIVKGLTETLDDETRRRVLDDLKELLVDRQSEGGVQLGTAAWLITARRT